MYGSMYVCKSNPPQESMVIPPDSAEGDRLTRAHTHTHTHTYTFMHTCIHTHIQAHIFFQLAVTLCSSLYFCLTRSQS